MIRRESPAALCVRNALLVDGSGTEPQVGDLLVEDGRISALGVGLTAPAGAEIIQADGLACSPGFIDMHAHSDLAVLSDGDHLAKVTQGVTTEVLGQDGLSYVPSTDESIATVRTQIKGWNGEPAGVDWSWRSVADYLQAIDDFGPALNAAYLLPHGTIRMNAVGNERRAASPNELTQMRHQIAQGMREGAFGLSAGLSYVPGMFADTDELVTLCAEVAKHGGYFAPHQRSYGLGALEGYAEMVTIAERAACALHLTHATMNFAVNRGRAGELLALIDAAIARGVDLSLDTYPYLPGATTLAALLPSWAAEGGPDATLARLRDTHTADRIAHALTVTGTDGCHGVVAEWDTIEISGTHAPELAPYVGSTIAELAAAAGRAPVDVCLEILVVDELATTILQHVGDEQNVRAIMQHPTHTGGSDGILVGAKPHPRAWGTFPRFLGHYARETGVLGLAETVAHLTSRPARRLGLQDRGVLRRGAIADLVLFDPATVAAGSSFSAPRTQAIGIPWVWVNGVAVLADGHRTDARPGRALRHTSPRLPTHRSERTHR